MLRTVDIEGTIDFILKAQARSEVRVEGIAKVLQQGMRMLVKTDKALTELAQAQKRTESRVAELAQAQKELTQAQKELAQAQRSTERTLKAFIDSMRHGRNGRNGR